MITFYIWATVAPSVRASAREIVGLCDEDPARMQDAARNFSIPPERLFTDYRVCLEQTRPDAAILCPALARMVEYAENVAQFGVHIWLKPMADSLASADRMMQAAEASGKTLMINWPLVWSATHRTAKRLIDEGVIGQVSEVHYYGGNRGPLYHGADKIEVSEDEVQRRKPASWFYKLASGGGSLRDYLGYGVTLGTWFMDGRKPLEVTTVVDEPVGLEVDEHSVTVARYEHIRQNSKRVGEPSPIRGHCNRNRCADLCWWAAPGQSAALIMRRPFACKPKQILKGWRYR
ncbi:MAG: Gfo/Idh/MocA family oxidoreductase [Acidobacteriota bacterium]